MEEIWEDGLRRWNGDKVVGVVGKVNLKGKIFAKSENLPTDKYTKNGDQGSFWMWEVGVFAWNPTDVGGIPLGKVLDKCSIQKKQAECFYM